MATCSPRVEVTFYKSHVILTRLSSTAAGFHDPPERGRSAGLPVSGGRRCILRAAMDGGGEEASIAWCERRSKSAARGGIARPVEKCSAQLCSGVGQDNRGEAAIPPYRERGTRSVCRHGEVDRGSPSSADRRVVEAGGVPGVRHQLADAGEDARVLLHGDRWIMVGEAGGGSAVGDSPGFLRII